MYSFESKEALTSFLNDNILNTAEACEILGCSRQNIDYLVKKNILTPIKFFQKDKIFLKEDILKYKDI